MTVSPKLQLQQLVDLQKIDDQISEHKKNLADIPLQLESARGELEVKKNILKVVTDEFEALQKKVKFGQKWENKGHSCSFSTKLLTLL